MSRWDGTYSSTYESGDGLEGDILRGMEGKSTFPTSTGGTIRQSDSRIDVYGPSDSSKGHSHSWYNGSTNESGHHD